MSSSAELLVVLARAPVAGRTKTRLIAALGPEGAAALHAAFIADVVARHQRSGRRMVLYTTDEHPLWAALGVTVARQPEGDLGARLAAILRAEAARQPTRLVVLGTDSPTLPPEHVDAAFERLRSAPVVLGPAADGGYYLLGWDGVGAPPPIFEGVPWGTDRVLGETVARLKAAGWAFSLLPEWYDVDEPHDLDVLRADVLRPGPDARTVPPQTALWLAEWAAAGTSARGRR